MDENKNKTIEVVKEESSVVESEKNVNDKRINKKEAIEIFHATCVRLGFLTEAIILLIFVVCIVNSLYFLFLLVLLLVIIADGLFIAIKRKGKEFKWFSISIGAFSIIFIITVWCLVFHKLNLGDPGCKNANLTSFSNGEFCFPLTTTICDFLYILVQLILIFFTIGRWQMPIENLHRDTHIDLIMVLLIACADCADFFKYTIADEVKDNVGAVTAIMVLWTFSLIQFSVTFTAVRERAKNRHELSKLQRFIDLCFSTKLWSILLVMTTQDIPYFITRIVLVFYFKVTADRTIFLFIIKNGMLVYFDIYRMYFILKDYVKEEKTIEPAKSSTDVNKIEKDDVTA